MSTYQLILNCNLDENVLTDLMVLIDDFMVEESIENNVVEIEISVKIEPLTDSTFANVVCTTSNGQLFEEDFSL